MLVLPNIEMNPPQVYICSPSWTLLPPPSPYHPSLSYHTIFPCICIFSASFALGLVAWKLWRRKWQPAAVFLPGKSHGLGSLAGCSSWGFRELDTAEHTVKLEVSKNIKISLLSEFQWVQIPWPFVVQVDLCRIILAVFLMFRGTSNYWIVWMNKANKVEYL